MHNLIRFALGFACVCGGLVHHASAVAECAPNVRAVDVQDRYRTGRRLEVGPELYGKFVELRRRRRLDPTEYARAADPGVRVVVLAREYGLVTRVTPDVLSLLQANGEVRQIARLVEDTELEAFAATITVRARWLLASYRYRRAERMQGWMNQQVIIEESGRRLAEGYITEANADVIQVESLFEAGQRKTFWLNPGLSIYAVAALQTMGSSRSAPTP